jgi:hypothetical protein
MAITYVPTYMFQETLVESYPFGGTPTTMTCTVHTSTNARVFPFEMDRPITLRAVYIRTNVAISKCLRIGIFDSSGTRLWSSDELTTGATRWVPALTGTPAFPINLPLGTYYFVTTNNNITSSSAAYTVTPALGSTLPSWGHVATTSGSMPEAINPQNITMSVGGWMCYVLLSSSTK